MELSQVIMQAAMVGNGWKQRRTVIGYARKSLGLFIDIFSGLLTNMQKSCKECFWIKSLFAPKSLVYCGKIKSSETVFRVILSQKN